MQSQMMLYPGEKSYREQSKLSCLAAGQLMQRIVV